MSSTGQVDSFNPSITGTEVDALAVQSNGSVIIAGLFTSVNGVSANNIARVSSTGLIDTSFAPSTNGEVYSLAVQPDGSIIA